jgi:hypothetical protein
LIGIELQQPQQQENIICTRTTLSEARFRLAVNSSGEFVFFGGGHDSTTETSRVDIYNVTNGSWSIATLSQPRYQLASTLSINKIFFGGGDVNSSNQSSDIVDIFEIPFPQSMLNNFSWIQIQFVISFRCLRIY